MEWMFVVFLASMLPCAIIALVARRLLGRRSSIVLCLLLPVATYFLVMQVYLEYATCSGEDCGRLMFVVAGFVALFAVAGAVAGVIAAVAFRSWRHRRTVKAELPPRRPAE